MGLSPQFHTHTLIFFLSFYKKNPHKISCPWDFPGFPLRPRAVFFFSSLSLSFSYPFLFPSISFLFFHPVHLFCSFLLSRISALNSLSFPSPRCEAVSYSPAKSRRREGCYKHFSGVCEAFNGIISCFLSSENEFGGNYIGSFFCGTKTL